MDYTTYLLEHGPEDVDIPIFIDAERPPRQVTKRQYISIVKRTAVALRDIVGIADQDCVALLSGNDICYYVLCDGVTAADGVFIALPPSSKHNELTSALATANVTWIFAEPHLVDRAVEAMVARGLPESHVFVFDPVEEHPYIGPRMSFSQLMAEVSESAYQSSPSPRECSGRIAFRVLTSGSTGTAKAAEISHSAAVARLTILDMAPARMKSKRLHVIAMHHASGQIISNMAVLGKLPAYISRFDDPCSSVDNIARHGIATVWLYPRLMEDMTSFILSGKRSKEALQTLKEVRTAGSFVRPEALTAFKELLASDAQPLPTYGCTEIGNMTRVPPGKPWIPGFVGGPAPGVDLLLVDPTTLAPVPPGSIGEICARSPTLFTRYTNDEAGTEESFIDIPGHGKFHRTGDRGYWSSEHKQLAVTGRYKETFKVGSEDVCPEEVESVVAGHSAVIDAAVTWIKGRRGQGECEVVAYVVVQDDVAAQELVDFVASELSPHKAPTGGVNFCDAIPRTSSGKIERKRLKDIQGRSRSLMMLDVKY